MYSKLIQVREKLLKKIELRIPDIPGIVLYW